MAPRIYPQQIKLGHYSGLAPRRFDIVGKDSAFRFRFFSLLLYEPEVEGDQKQREVYEASYSQKLRGHRKSEERNGNTDVIPRKIPTRPRRDKKRAGEKLKNILPVDSHS